MWRGPGWLASRQKRGQPEVMSRGRYRAAVLSGSLPDAGNTGRQLNVRTHLRLFSLAVAAALASAGVCARKLYPPEFVSIPHSVYAGEAATVRLAASGNGYDSVRYVVNWDDGTIDTTAPLGLGDTATVLHAWSASPDTKYVRAAVFAVDDPQGIRWGIQRQVAVEAGGSHAPVVDSVLCPLAAVSGETTRFLVYAHDPDGDSIRAVITWGDSTDTTTATSFLPSPSCDSVSHIFTHAETADVVVSVQDRNGALSLPDDILVPVIPPGGSVKWYWQSAQQGIFNTSPLCQYDGQDECVYASAYWDECFYSIRVRSGKVKYHANPRLPPYVFTGQPAFCAATQHFILGSEEGELYALGPGLVLAWRWPNAPSESLEPFVLFGAPAIKDNRLYVPREDDSLYCFIDSIDHGVRVATFPAGAGIVDAPVIDAQGNVYFGTDSGYLYKVGADLDTLFWRTRLVAGGEIYSLIVGGDGTIFCSSGLSRIYAIDPATGTLLWTAATEGLPLRLVAGRTAIFAGTDFGTVYSVNPATGSVNWRRAFGQGFGFHTAPVVAANGCVYLQDDDAVPFCLRQTDGTPIWVCDCDSYLPGGINPEPRRTHFPDYHPSPTITSTGDIIVPGKAAVFCVACYPKGQLDPLALWPKWQHDLHNTGYAGGGR